MLYLAMTATEIAGNPNFPGPMAWMACQFAPYGTGLSNLPAALPENSILMLSDQLPLQGHNPTLIASQLGQAAEALGCSHILLDLQRPGDVNAEALVRQLLDTLPCPVIVSEPYAAGLDCPVLLPPMPLHKTLGEHLAPWEGREIWIEAALNACTVTVTQADSQFSPCEEPPNPLPHQDRELNCHYSLRLEADAAVFTLHRSWEDLEKLMESELVTGWVGLYQELKSRL